MVVVLDVEVVVEVLVDVLVVVEVDVEVVEVVEVELVVVVVGIGPGTAANTSKSLQQSFSPE